MPSFARFRQIWRRRHRRGMHAELATNVGRQRRIDDCSRPIAVLKPAARICDGEPCDPSPFRKPAAITSVVSGSSSGTRLGGVARAGRGPKHSLERRAHDYRIRRTPGATPRAACRPRSRPSQTIARGISRNCPSVRARDWCGSWCTLSLRAERDGYPYRLSPPLGRRRWRNRHAYPRVLFRRMAYPAIGGAAGE